MHLKVLQEFLDLIDIFTSLQEWKELQKGILQYTYDNGIESLPDILIQGWTMNTGLLGSFDDYYPNNMPGL